MNDECRIMKEERGEIAECGFRIAEWPIRAGSASDRSRLANHGSRTTNHDEAHWPNKAICAHRRGGIGIMDDCASNMRTAGSRPRAVVLAARGRPAGAVGFPALLMFEWIAKSA